MSNSSSIFSEVARSSNSSEADLIPATTNPVRPARVRVNQSDSDDEVPSTPVQTFPRPDERKGVNKPSPSKSSVYGSNYTSVYSQSSLLGGNPPKIKSAASKHWAVGDAPHQQPTDCHSCGRILELLEAMRHDNKSLRHEIKSLAISIGEMRTELHCLKESTSRFPTTSAGSKVVKINKGPKYDDGNI